jgi:N-acetylglucosaminylphosphatidylinositol deacetylase
MDWIDIVFILKWLALLFNFGILAYAINLANFSSFLKTLPVIKDVLIVIAHPDDEVMFFLPLISQLSGVFKIHLLCISNGNADGLGETRT